MPGMAVDEKWRSTPNSLRKRKIVQITLSPEAIARLAELADKYKKTRSEIVEMLVFGQCDE